MLCCARLSSSRLRATRISLLPSAAKRLASKKPSQGELRFFAVISWDGALRRMHVKNHQITVQNALLATLLHTAIIYGAPAFGLHKVDIGRILGDVVPVAGRKRKRSIGLACHLLLGTLVFPTCFNLLARPFLPKGRIKSSLDWALNLWFVGQNLIIPMLGKGRLFRRYPDTTGTYLLAHLVYGLGCARR